MSMVGTFDGFTAARLGIYAAQHGLRVTGNNVANINTVGYTRQRVDQTSFKVGVNDMYRSFYDNHVGSGALVTGINQIRDPYLDIRYRNASTDTYHYDTWLAGLQNIASILDEVGKGEGDHEGDGLIYAQLQDLADKLRAYGNNPTPLNERLVRNSAESLTSLFHNAADQLEKLYNETKTEFGENISAVNEILTNIRDLNKSIREAEIHGDAALEMRDERNRQIDALSQYLDISVTYSFEDVGGGIQVEKLTIKLNDANPDPSVTTDSSTLVDGLYATQLSVPEEKPALNLFPENSEYAYLNKFLYRREVSEDEANQFLEVLKSKGITLTLADIQAKNEDGTPKLDDNNNPVYLIGTNDPDLDGVVMEENTNFTIQLSQLVNSKGAPWKNTTTAWTELSGTDLPKRAQYTYNIDVPDPLDPDLAFIITDANGNQTSYKVSDVGANVTKAKLMAFIAQKMNEAGRYPDYNITANADGDLIFTAKNPGEVGKDEDRGAPADEPNFEVTALDGTPWLTSTLDRAATVEGNLPDNAPDSFTETDEHGNVTKSISYVQVDGKWYQITIRTEYTHEVTLDDNDLRGILQAQRELLTEEGEFSSEYDVAIDESALIKRGIPYYQKSLDLLAQKFAQAYNQLNQGYAYNQNGNYIDADGNELLFYDPYAVDEDGNPDPGNRPASAIDGLTYGQRLNLLVNSYVLQDDEGYVIDENGNRITDENGDFIKSADITFDNVTTGVISQEVYDKLTVDMERYMRETFGIEPMGGALFTQLDGKTTTGINASNISISSGWSNGAIEVIRTFEKLFTDDGSGGLTNSTQPSNINHMIAMIEKSLTYNPRDLYGSDAIGPELFNGSFNDMLSNMMAKQGEDASITSTRLTTSAGIMSEVDFSRDGVSGVDLNDEAMNMITYQKAMSASMRVMTVIDEMLDRLINNTAI